jgi:hypothetical protein
MEGTSSPPTNLLGSGRRQNLELVGENCPGDGPVKSGLYVPPHRRKLSDAIDSITTNEYINDSKITVPSRDRDRTFARKCIQFLDECEVIRQVQFGQKCPKCESDDRTLDESKMILIPKSMGGSLEKKFFQFVNSITRTESTFISADGPVKVQALQGGAIYLPYEMRQALVNSGLFSREQLSLSGWHFSQHELEVNDRSFYHIRPHSCADLRGHFWEEVGNAEAPFWSLGAEEQFPQDDSSNLSECPPGMEDQYAFGFYLEDIVGESSQLQALKPDTKVTKPLKLVTHSTNPAALTAVETEFILGDPVRTGFRRRSKSSTLRRKLKNVRRTFGFYRIRVPLPQEACLLFNIVEQLPPTVKLELSNLSLIRKRRYNKRHTRTSRPNRSSVIRGVTQIRRPPKSGFKKYSYFFRKRGYYYLSKHHPLQGDWGS